MTSKDDNRYSSSCRLAHISLDRDRLASDLKGVESMERSASYGYFQYGERWSSIMLANHSGDARDGISKIYDGSALATEQMKLVPYLWEVTRDVFECRYLKSMRIFDALNGGILPHRDYWDLEVKPGASHQPKRFNRIHLAIQTNSNCLNSEEDRVYHINLGDIVYLDGSRTHACIAYGNQSRLHVIWDFDPTIQMEKLFKAKGLCKPEKLAYITRRAMAKSEMELLLSSGMLLSNVSLQVVLQSFAAIHFVREVSAGACYDWLVKVAQMVDKADLVAEAREIRHRYLGDTNESFTHIARHQSHG